MNGGVMTMLVLHEADCPALRPTPGACDCHAVPRLVSQAEFLAATTRTRAQRRAAARQADKAKRRAQRAAKGGNK